MRKILVLIFSVLSIVSLSGTTNLFSTAGFYAVPNSGRNVYDFNVGWRFHRGDITGAEKVDFNDHGWSVVSTPHTVQLVPAAASGGKNYQGIAWYRKHFHTPAVFTGKKIWLYFEAIMGKSKIYVNGKMVTEHFGGYLPVIIDLSRAGVGPDQDCLISVCADNSDDPTYPPGKSQTVLDFCYFGGIYRDCWLYTTDDIHITDPNYAAQTAGGGVFIATEKAGVSEAVIKLKTQVINEGPSTKTIVVSNRLTDSHGKLKASIATPVTLKAGESQSVDQTLRVKDPQLWHPDHPYLNTLRTSLFLKNKLVDAIDTRAGIRTIEFIPGKGLSINGEILHRKLLGVNRHQDFGYIGNALTNNLQMADVRKMRDAGITIIRSAHYPQDPAFMDACDQLGMFIIVATPGWQFWNNNGEFEDRVVSDIRNMVRRDRNHPSVLLWEPILNETHYPVEFAGKAYKTVHEEYPYKGCYAACDGISPGHEVYDVLYTGPNNEEFYTKLGKCCFTREFGDCVDDWYSHNSYSRVSREWSEQALIFQAQHYAKKDYEGSLTIDQLFKSPPSHVGGALWAGFDHQRGYHPDPFFGGLMDVFRQPKYSYFMFMSQRDPSAKYPFADSGPMLFIANAMTPFSPTDVTVYSNCDSVRLIIMKQKTVAGTRIFYRDTICQPVVKNNPGIPNEPVTFRNAFDFVTVRAMQRANRRDDVKMIAEGIIGGKVVVRKVQMPSLRSAKIQLGIDTIASPCPLANGSDIVEIIASVVDDRGYVKQLADEQIQFSVSGEGSVIGDCSIGANPVRVVKGTAPLLIRTTTKAGKVTVIARTYFGGINSPAPDTLTFCTHQSETGLLFTDSVTPEPSSIQMNEPDNSASSEKEREKLLQKVEADQQYFESTEKKK